MKIGLTVHPSRPAPANFARQLADRLVAAGHDLTGDAYTAQTIGRDIGEAGAEIMLAIGGDGTVLEAARRALARDIPVLGFNLGTIGFLAEVSTDELEHVVDAITAGRLTERRRMTVSARIGEGRSMDGLNDIVVEKIHSQRLVFLTVTIDGEEFLTYRADGVVTATPTGSTAYSFSAGGPLVDPAIRALLFTPVAAHSLFNRTVVLPEDSRISITVSSDRPVRVSVDGVEFGYLAEHDTVEITRGERDARFLTIDDPPFPATVKNKFRLT
ncbi:MAG: NAD(+)/NADH kinase [Actinobacteria bacterium]|nr:NAD(+)/NADH kinase [Actinomycetota bacterium]